METMAHSLNPHWQALIACGSVLVSAGLVILYFVWLFSFGRKHPEARGFGPPWNNWHRIGTVLYFLGVILFPFVLRVGQTSVTYRNFEIVEDPETRRKFAAGVKFEKEWDKRVDEPEGPIVGILGGRSCVYCRNNLNQEPTRGRMEKEFRFEGMKPFTRLVDAPLLVCSECETPSLADWNEYVNADVAAFENAGLDFLG